MINSDIPPFIRYEEYLVANLFFLGENLTAYLVLLVVVGKILIHKFYV